MGENLKQRPENLIELQGIYLHECNEITRPDQQILCSNYFLKKWVPELGQNLFMLIMQLRRHCLFDISAGVNHNTTKLSLDQLATACGISKATVKRELAKPISKLFVMVSPNYQYDQAVHRKVRTSNTYHVAIDDPIHPSDSDKLLQIKEQRTAVRDVEASVNDLKLNLSSRSSDLKLNLSPRSPASDLKLNLSFRSDASTSILSTPSKAQIEPTSTNVNVNTMNVNVQGKNVNVQKTVKQEVTPLTHHQEALVEKILSVTKDPKSAMFYKQVAINCSQANIENAIEDLKTYAASGRKIKNPGALFTSRIKNLDPYFRLSKSGRG